MAILFPPFVRVLCYPSANLDKPFEALMHQHLFCHFIVGNPLSPTIGSQEIFLLGSYFQKLSALQIWKEFDRNQDIPASLPMAIMIRIIIGNGFTTRRLPPGLRLSGRGLREPSGSSRPRGPMDSIRRTFVECPCRPGRRSGKFFPFFLHSKTFRDSNLRHLFNKPFGTAHA